MPPIAFIGPSGAGKSTLATQLLMRFPDLTLVRTYTTRLQRSDNDTSHIFITDTEFDHMLATKQFIGTIEDFDARYGLTMPPAHITPLFIVRVPAVAAFRALYPTGVVFEIDAPIEQLKQRLTARGDVDRINPTALEQEIALGRQQSDHHVDTAHSVNDCMHHIERLILSRNH